MADINDIVPDNISGKFFVDTECIDCDLCRETAKDNFTRSDEEGYSYVYKQPENDDELEFKKDDVLEVIEIIEEPAGWLMAKHQKNGKSGMIPDTYVKKMKTTSKLIPVKESKKSCIVM